MSIFDNNPIITQRRLGDSTSPFVDINESHQIENSKVVLTEIPDSFTKVQVSGQGVTWYEKSEGIPNENEYVVDYNNKIVTFHNSRNGLQLQFIYKGTGLQYVPTSMIYTQSNNGEVTETLKQLTNETAIARDTANQTNTDIQLAEDARVTNENTRVTNEATRETNETTRQTNESTRETNESNRANAETARSTNEDTRQTNETIRETNESARVAAETNRANAESTRETNENIRVTNETNRTNAETTRENNETTRQNNETTRITQESQRQTNTNNAITRLDTAVNTTKMEYLSPVSTYSNISTTYPTPKIGYTVQVMDTNDWFRYDGTSWRLIQNLNLSGYVTESKLQTELNKLQVELGYGLEWNKISDTYKRVGQATGKDRTFFDTVAPFNQIRRCNLADNGTVNAYYGDPTYIEDGSNGQVMVEIPKFWYKTEILSDGYRWFISPIAREGYRVHPAFVRNGIEKNKIYISAYEGSLYDVSALAYLLNNEQVADFTVGTGDKLCSIANVKPASGLTQDLTLPNSRILAQNRGTGWELQDFMTVSAVQMLFIVEYSTLNSQSIFNGVTNIADDGANNMAVNTGATSSLGNSSGQVNITHPQTGQTTTPFSYRGIENFYGNIWKWVDGLNIQADNKPYVADSDFVSDKYDGNYTYLGVVLPNANGYFSDVVVNENIGYGFLPSQATGSSTTKFADYYYQSTGNRVALLGGTWHYGGYAGAFHWTLYYSSATRNRFIAARLLYVG